MIRWLRFRRPRLAFGLLVLALLGGTYWLPPVRANRLLDRAERALDERQADEAITLLTQAQSLDRDSPRAEFLLARAARRQGRFSDVQLHLARAARLGFDHERLQRENWLAMAQAGRMQEAGGHLESLLRDPRGDAPNICEAYVEGYFATYRFDLALPLLDAWSADFPDDPQPHFYRGAYFEHFDNWPEAADCYRHAFELDPQRADVALRLANLLVQLHEYEEAAVYFRVCLESSPDDPKVRCGWAECLLALGDAAASRDVIEQLFVEERDNAEARYVLAQIQHSDGQDADAHESLRFYCERNPTDSEARYLYAQVLQALGRQDEAAEHFQFVAESRERVQEIEPLMARLKNDPTNADIRYEIGIRVLTYDIPEHGAEWLRSAVDAQPDHALAHAALAEYYSAAGQLELAEHHRRFGEAADNAAATPAARGSDGPAQARTD